MLSRVAESIYWLSRYIERAENVARVVGVNNRLQLDLPDLADEQWDPMVKVTGDEERFQAGYEAATRSNVIEFLTFDAANPNSIFSCLTRARENARSVREIISSEMWEEVNRFYLFLREPDARQRAMSDAHAFFEHVRRSSHLIEGTKNETMEHAEAWHFSRIGRFIERADQTTRILDVKYFLLLPSADDVGKPIDDLQWGALLRSASAFEAYRRTHGRVAARAVASFLLLNHEFPRSVHHCASEAQISLHAVTGTPIRRFANAAERALGRLVAELDYTDIVDVIRSGLHDFLDAIQDKLNGVGREITHNFLCATLAGRIVAMTYCVAMNVEDGIVGLSDTLITSGREVTTLRKVNVYSPPRGTFFVMTSGLRSLRDKTLTYFEDRLAERASRDEPFERLYQAVNLLAEQVRAVAREDKASLQESGVAFNIHALIGGQMERDARQKLYLLYPEGNWVDTGRLTPYHVIGSVGYGKPLLDRTLRVEDSMRHAFKVACLSFDSTRISAADVGFPIDVVLYRRNSFRIIERRFHRQDLEQLSRWWDGRIRRAIEETPRELLDRAYDEIEPAPPAPVSTVS